MVSSITQGADTASFNYNLEHNRGQVADSSSGNTTWYFENPAAGTMSEMLQAATTTWRDYVVAGGHIVAERFTTGGTASMYYFVGDHLSSTTTLTDANQNQKEYDAYDAWGKRRNANGTDISNCISLRPPSMTLRGFTGQEEMDSFCLVDLNARMYDPSLGRFLSADTIGTDVSDGQSYSGHSDAQLYSPSLGDLLSAGTSGINMLYRQSRSRNPYARRYDRWHERLPGADPSAIDTLNGQGYNRYSYVQGRPLVFVDPTGHVPDYIHMKDHPPLAIVDTNGSADNGGDGAGGDELAAEEEQLAEQFGVGDTEFNNLWDEAKDEANTEDAGLSAVLSFFDYAMDNIIEDCCSDFAVPLPVGATDLIDNTMTLQKPEGVASIYDMELNQLYDSFVQRDMERSGFYVPAGGGIDVENGDWWSDQ